jgi:Stigma-specific protein, Stig1
VRLLVLIPLLLAACSAPCPLLCQDDTQCPPGFYCLNQAACLQDCKRCSGSCVDTFSNCGTCGLACAAGMKCSFGTCKDSCDPGLTDCNGSCYDLTKDRTNCGSCGNACATDETCVSGATGPKCTKVDVCA